MLYPYGSESREVKDLSGVWQFKWDKDNVGMLEKWYEKALEVKELIPVPASYNDITQNSEIRDHIGDVWYETQVIIPKSWSSQRIVLRFGSITHLGHVWVNGKFVISHKGGYLPFEALINDYIEPGKKNRITVCVNNILDWQTLPPGEVVELVDEYKYPEGTRMQKYFHDFYNYAGIHRPVKLYTTPQSFIEDLTVKTKVEGNKGIINYEVVSQGVGEVTMQLFDKEGKMVAEAKGSQGMLVVEAPILWQPLKSYLYKLVAKLTNEVEEDVYSLKVGIRTIKVEGNQFLINDRPFYFKGFGKHEDMNLKGKGLDDVLNIKDFNLMNWIGANSFRTSHYPYAEEILDLADEYGLVVIDESPAVGMTFFNETDLVFIPERVNNQTKEHHLEVMRELINRDKNRTCVVMWSVANEPSSWEEGARSYFKDIIEETRRLDSTRAVTMVTYAFPYGTRFCKVSDMVDVICINKYYSWYEDSGRLDLIEYQAEKELKLWHEYFNKPIIMTEYGADSIVGFHQDPPVMFTEEYQIEMIKHFNNVFDRLDFVIGEHIWAFSDFATKQGTTRIIGNRKGVFTRDRAPKSIAYVLKERWHKK